MPRNRERYLSRTNRVAVGVHSRDAIAADLKSLHFAVLDDVHAQRIRGARISPGNGIVPRSASAALDHSAQNRNARLRRPVRDRQELANLLARHELAVD